MGRVPVAHRGLSEGASLLLPIARAIIKRYNCKTEGSRWRSDDFLIKAFTGNVCAVPQATSGALHTHAPVSEEAIQESLLLAFTGLEEDLEKAYYKSLGVPIGEFRRAVEYTRRCNKVYAQRHWDDEHGFARLSTEGQPLGLPRIFASCLKRQVALPGEDGHVKLQGPAEAVAGGQDEEPRLRDEGPFGEVGKIDGSYEERVAWAAGILEELRSWLQEHEDVMPRGAFPGPEVAPEAVEHELNIQRRYLEHISSGLKTVEARVCVGAAANIAEGDVLKLGHVRCLVKERRVYEGMPCNVRAMLEQLGVDSLLPGCASVSEGVRIYHAIRFPEWGSSSWGGCVFLGVASFAR